MFFANCQRNTEVSPVKETDYTVATILLQLKHALSNCQIIYCQCAKLRKLFQSYKSGDIQSSSRI